MNITATVSILILLFFVISILPYVLKEVNQNIDDQINTYLSVWMVFLELIAHNRIIKKTIDKIEKNDFPTSFEFKSIKALTNFNYSKYITSASNA